MMLLSRVIFRKFGWGVAASITPTVLLVTGVAFFGLILFSGPLTPLLGTWGLTPLMAAVYVGALQNIFSKSAKYSLFDPCKEMAYIPLDEETKVWTPFRCIMFRPKRMAVCYGMLFFVVLYALIIRTLRAIGDISFATG